VNGPIRRVSVAIFLALLALLGSSTWIQVISADTYRLDPRNARTALSLSSKERGVIVTSDGVVLARSEPLADDPRSFTRSYPEGATFAHVVGYASALVGSSGVEAAYTDVLRSRRDLTISDLIAALFGRDLRPLSLELTIDAGVQETAVAAMGAQKGAIVAMDPRNGAILAYASFPSFDPMSMLGSDAPARRVTLLEDPGRPLLDRVGRELYPPGSVFKVVTAAAGLDTGVVGPETLFPDEASYQLPGSTAAIRNFDDGPCLDGASVTLQTGFVRSCNTVFARLANELGAETIDRMATALGFNRTIEFPLPIVPSVFPRASTASDPAALAQSGIGQRDVRANAMGMALVAAAVANDGVLMQPQVVKQVFNADGATVRQLEPQELSMAMSPAAAAVLSQMMERVVTEGTGRRAAIPGIRVAGKTGTAENPGRAPDLWFIGFAPLPDPSIVVAVLVEEGGSIGEDATGGSVAAPIAAKIIEAWLGN